jgi:outer membrane protein OmpA-like peptidoglycan-associated protein
MTRDTQTNQPNSNTSSSKRVAKKQPKSFAYYVVIVLVVMYGSYLGGSAWYLPSYLKQGIPQWLSQVIIESTDSPVTRSPLQGYAADIKFNPFSLKLTIEGLNISEQSSKNAPQNASVRPSDLIFSADKIIVNLELRSLLKQALVLSEFTIEGPQTHITKNAEGRFLWDRIVGEASQSEAAAADSQNQEVFPVIIDKFAIAQASLTYSDFALETPYQKTMSPINLELFNLSTLPNDQGIYELNVKLPQPLNETLQNDAHHYPEAEFIWRGELSLNPLSSNGRLQLNHLSMYSLWEYLQDQVLYKPLSGDFQITLDYDFSMAEELSFKIGNGHVQLNNLIIEPKSNPEPSSEPLLSVKEHAIEGIYFDLAEQSLSIDEIRYQAVDGIFNRLEDGSLQLIKILSERPVRAALKETVEETTESTQWKVDVEQFKVIDSRLLVQDFTTQTPMTQRIEDINITMNDFSNYQNDLESALTVAMSLPVSEEKKGRFNAKGQLSSVKQTAELTLDLSQLHLPAFEPYLESISKLDITSADLGINGQLSLQDQKVVFNGSSQITNIELNNQNYLPLSSKQEPIANILSGQGIYVDGITLDQQQNKLEIKNILLDRMVYPFSIFAEGKATNTNNKPAVVNNFQNLFKAPQSTQNDQKQDHSGTEPTDSAQQPAMQVSIDQVRFENNQLIFTDQTPAKPVLVEIEQLNGNISGLSSENTQKAGIALAGEVNGYAPFKVTGQLNPLSEELYTDISITLDELSLTTFSPYAAQHLGYGIEQGKFNTALNYQINQQNLKAANSFVIQQMELGDTSDNNQSIRLPMPLILTLLEDKEGNIDINLPVSGNLDDPNFKYGHIVWKSFKNLLQKAATSPFNALASLANLDQAPDQVLFNSNQSELSEDQQQYLNQLAKALKEKPDLKLSITGLSALSEIPSQNAQAANTSTETALVATPVTPNKSSEVTATRLAKARAKAVYDFMKAQGIANNQLYLRKEQTQPTPEKTDNGLLTGVKLGLF